MANNIPLNNEGKEVKPDMDNVIQDYNVFKTLNAVNVNEYIEKKNGLKYLSWASAWREIKKRYPDATYEVVKFDGLPYVYDEKTGYMCYTKVTINGLTHEMWLPVLDYANNAMKAEPYEIQTKYKKVTVQAATMFEINKTIMRCLVKSLGMFGLGLYIFCGEDLPEMDDNTINVAKNHLVQSNTKTSQATAPNPVQSAAQTRPAAPNPVQSVASNQAQQTSQVTKSAPKNNWVPAKSFK